MLSGYKYDLSCMALVAILALSGCASTNDSYDYSLFRAHMPRSILVLPPINESVEVNASYIYLSTITRPLAEAGYYVYPVAVVDSYMKENGLPTPYEMNAVPLDNLAEVFDPDAVLYITIEDWGQKYTVLSSTTVVKARARLVDVATGTTIWEGTALAQEGSGDGGGGLIGMVVAAVVDQIIDTTSDRVRAVSALANTNMIQNTGNGFLRGPYISEDSMNESAQ